MTDPITLGTWVDFDVFPVISENRTERRMFEFVSSHQAPAGCLQRWVFCHLQINRCLSA